MPGKGRSFRYFCQGVVAGLLVGFVSGLRGPGGAPPRPVPPSEEPVAVDPPGGRLPGPAAVRRLHPYGLRERVIARRQMYFLVGLLILVGAGSWYGYEQIRYESPPLIANADSPKFRISVPGEIDSMRFEVTDVFTTVDVTVSKWSAGETVTVSADAGNEIEILGLSARTRTGETIPASAWRTVTDQDAAQAEGSYLKLTPQLAVPPSGMSLTFRNGLLTRSGQYQFLRTDRVEIYGDAIGPESTSGTVTVNTGSYTVERLATGGVSRPGETEGTTTRYSVTAARVPGANKDALQVPAVSIDMVDVQRHRGRDPLLLILGAILGIVGALIIEIGLTSAHLSASREG